MRSSARHEARLEGEPWTRDKMDDAGFRKMLTAIAGFEMEVPRLAADLQAQPEQVGGRPRGVIEALEAQGSPALAALMRSSRHERAARRIRLRRHAVRRAGRRLRRDGARVRRLRLVAPAEPHGPANRRAEPAGRRPAPRPRCQRPKITPGWSMPTSGRSSRPAPRAAWPNRFRRDRRADPLAARGGWQLGVATGKSDRGLHRSARRCTA